MRALVIFLCERLSLAVAAICTVVMVLVFVNVEFNAPHLGSYSVVFQNNSDRVVVTGESTADGLQTGDRIDLGALTPRQRYSLLATRSDAHMTIHVIRGGRSFPVRLSANPPDYSRRTMLTRDIGIPFSFFLSLGLATALFLMRPRPITLAFYAYTMLMLVKVYQSTLDVAKWPMNVSVDLVMQVVYPLAQLMILIFAQRLYGRPSRAFRWFLWIAGALSVLAFIAWVDPIVWVVFQRFGLPGPTRLFMSGSDTLLLVTVLAGLAYIASGATAIDRGRVTWVIAGIALAPILDLTWALSDIASAMVGDTSTALLAVGVWTDALLPWFGLVGTVFVLYGFLSQRVIDFRLAIGRAALYGATTLILVFFFGVIEWWAEQLFESTRPAIYVSLAAALCIGFSLNALHGRIEDFLGGFFFREQRDAEDTLRRAARALANTSSERTLVEFLIDEPLRVLGLASSALFLVREDDGFFQRTAARGWNDAEAETIDAEDPLVIALRTELASVPVHEWQGGQTPMPTGAKAPALIVPLVMRGSVFGFVFYGAKCNGAPIEPAERTLLEAIAVSAAAAFDHIDADKSRTRISMLERRLNELGATP